MSNKGKKVRTSGRFEVDGQDIVIPVIGPSGSGKSTFINFALGKDRLKIGHGLSPCTKKPQSVIIDPFPRFPELKGRRVILVDTPGLCGSKKADEDILQQIVTYLGNSYKDNKSLLGVIYLYDISNDRLSTRENKNLERIQRLCRDAALSKVVLATTQCRNTDAEGIERRVKSLTETYWKGLVENGAEILHFQGDSSSAWQIIDVFLRLAMQSPLPASAQLRSHSFQPDQSQPIEDPFQDRGQVGVNASNAALVDGKKTDIIIPILGPTGAGKSTFINSALGREVVTVGHGLNSCTLDLQPVVIDPIPGFPNLKGHRLILVDTPGFSDTYVEDAKVLQDVAAWLASSYRKEMVIVGVLYLHDISLKRFTHTARQNLGLFYRMCGSSAISQAVLATTNWGTIPQDIFKQHEVEMKHCHWQNLIEQGAEVRRFLNNSASAWEILSVCLERIDSKKRKPIPLLIQRELVEEGKTVAETSAGRFLRKVEERLRKMVQLRCFVQ